MAKTEIKAKLGLDTTAFQRGMAKSQRGISNFAKTGIAQMVRFSAAFLGLRLARDITGLGLAAGETASKFNAVFGPAADSMNEKVQELRKTIPATTAEMQNALATFAAMANGFGLNATAASLFSVEMVKISGDLASFHNLNSEEAFLKIRAAISGEFEPLKALGIVLSADLIKQEALNLGINDGTTALLQSQKAIAVQSLVLKNMGVAQGDAAATANSAANQVKFASAALKEFGTTIGVLLVPVIEDFTGGLKIMGGWMDKIKGKASEFDEFEKMAEELLTTRGELEKFGVLDQKVFGFQSQKSKEKQARNMAKLKVRADELRTAFKLLSDEEQKSIKLTLLSAKEQEGVKKRKKAQEDFLKQLEAIKDAQGSFGAVSTAVEEKMKEARNSEINQIEELKTLEEELMEVRSTGNAEQISSIKEKMSLQSEILNQAKQEQVDLKQRLKDIEAESAEKRRVGDFKGSRELLDQRFGIRGQIKESRGDERLARLRGGDGPDPTEIEAEQNLHLIQIEASMKTIEREMTR